MLDRNNWNHLTAEKIAILKFKQICFNSFKKEITYKFCVQTNDCYIAIFEAI